MSGISFPDTAPPSGLEEDTYVCLGVCPLPIVEALQREASDVAGDCKHRAKKVLLCFFDYIKIIGFQKYLRYPFFTEAATDYLFTFTPVKKPLQRS